MPNDDTIFASRPLVEEVVDIGALRAEISRMNIATWEVRHALERAIPYIKAQADWGDETAQRQLKAARVALARFSGSAD